MTPEAWASRWVQDELTLAYARRKTILAIMHKSTTVEGFIMGTQWIPAWHLTGAEAAQRVSAALEHPAVPLPLPAPPVAAPAPRPAGTFTVAPPHRAITAYTHTLTELRAHGVQHEGGLRRAFETLLATIGREVGWTLIAEARAANSNRPDATLQDAYLYPRGYWEAKDTADVFEDAIRRKIAQGYPTTNTIFEDTRQAALFQGDARYPVTFDLARPQDIADLLTQFFTYSEPDYKTFERAVGEFKERVPELAHRLLQHIRSEHQARNMEFTRAFDAFRQVCQEAIDPHITDAEIDDMLAQHLLTERLFRTIFDYPDFAGRNIIAREIEQVVQALTAHAFNRAEFLRGLDRFYLAIERAARSVRDYTEKQHFLNVVYERFFQGFAKEQADTHGIVYTPQPIVEFMCASVEDVLRREFGMELADERVKILDPCTGTGNFIVNLLKRIPGPALERKYRDDLFCNEIMLLPYYIASLNIEHAYQALMERYLPFEGICFADTLSLEGNQMVLFSERNTARIQRQRQAPLMVIIGNPPYNVGQVSENDNNKNRPYKDLDERIRGTYAKASKATLNTKLYDAYVRFFRWAADRLQGRDGIVCYVSNNSFIDQIAFDGMRKHLLQDFTQIWHLDLHGNVRKNPRLSGTTHNVFGIQVGVGITIAIRSRENPARGLWYHRVPEDWTKEQKLGYLTESQSTVGIPWQELDPDDDQNWLTEGMRPEFARFLPLGSKAAKQAKATELETIFKTYSLGVSTNRDSVVYDFDHEALLARLQQFIEDYNGEVFRWVRAGKPANIDDFVKYDRIKWSEHLKGELKREKYGDFNPKSILVSLYRPFSKQLLYYDAFAVDRPGLFRELMAKPNTLSTTAALMI